MKQKKNRVITATIVSAAAVGMAYYLLARCGPFGVALFGWIVPVSGMALPLACAAVLWVVIFIARGPAVSRGLAACAVFFFAACLIYSEIIFDPIKTIDNTPVALEKAPAGGFNLVLISLDTLRPDRLGAFGYRRETSPGIDGLAGRSTVFENVFSQSPNTQPSHAVIMTGLYPGTTGANMVKSPLPKSAFTLAERLREKGWRTAAFTGGGLVAAKLGFSQGFEIYNDTESEIAGSWPMAREWLEENGGEKFFLFLHCYDVHMPYLPPAPFNTMFYSEYAGPLPWNYSFETMKEFPAGVLSPEDIEHVSAIYDGGIRYTDQFIAEIAVFLEEKNLADNTVVVLLSDHGEELGEHGDVARHSHTVFNELLRVPLVIYVPGAKPGRVKTRAGLVDAVPSILDLLGVPYDAGGMQGASLSGFIGGDAPDIEEKRTIFAEQKKMAGNIGDRRAMLIRGDWKFIMPAPDNADIGIKKTVKRIFGGIVWPVRGRMLFNIKEDPGETKNLVMKNIPLARSMEYSLINICENNKKAGLKPDAAINLTDREQKKLKALGYVE